MSANIEASHGQSLIFRWPEKSASFVLPSLFLASVAAHALAFYVFQVAYPDIVSIAPPSKQVTFLAASPENDALLRWAAARDPSTAKDLREVTPPGLGEISYAPSYASAQTLLKPVDHTGESVVFPPALDSQALMAPALPPVSASQACVHSSLVFSESLHGRDATPGQAVVISAKSCTSLQRAVFLVGVGADGEVRYSFLQESCGNSDIDKEAQELLCRRRFTSAGASAPLIWGFAAFTWGADAFAEATQPSTRTPQ